MTSNKAIFSRCQRCGLILEELEIINSTFTVSHPVSTCVTLLAAKLRDLEDYLKSHRHSQLFGPPTNEKPSCLYEGEI